jgi:hypothetical protein
MTGRPTDRRTASHSVEGGVSSSRTVERTRPRKRLDGCSTLKSLGVTFCIAVELSSPLPNDFALQLRPAGARGSSEQRPKRDVSNCNELTLSNGKGRCTKGCSASCKRLLDGARHSTSANNERVRCLDPLGGLAAISDPEPQAIAPRFRPPEPMPILPRVPRCQGQCVNYVRGAPVAFVVLPAHALAAFDCSHHSVTTRCQVYCT